MWDQIGKGFQLEVAQQLFSVQELASRETRKPHIILCLSAFVHMFCGMCGECFRTGVVVGCVFFVSASVRLLCVGVDVGSWCVS